MLCKCHWISTKSIKYTNESEQKATLKATWIIMYSNVTDQELQRRNITNNTGIFHLGISISLFIEVRHPWRHCFLSPSLASNKFSPIFSFKMQMPYILHYNNYWYRPTGIYDVPCFQPIPLNSIEVVSLKLGSVIKSHV